MRRFIACVLLPCYLVACTSWKTQEVSPQQVIGEEQPDWVKVTLTNGSQRVIDQPTVSGDTLSGLSDTGTPVHIPLADVEHVAIEKTSALKTAALIYVMMGFAGIAILAAAGFPGFGKDSPD
jgi:hypothetical protein